MHEQIQTIFFQSWRTCNHANWQQKGKQKIQRNTCIGLFPVNQNWSNLVFQK